MQCPVCRSGRLEEFLDRGKVPVFCNVLYDSAEEARRAALGRLSLGYCAACGMIANTAFEPAAVRYARGYENAQHFSPRFRTYLERLAADLRLRHGLEGGHCVEIGCGDGTFLGFLTAGGGRGTGFDPALPDGVEPPPGVSLRRETFGASPLDPAPDLVACRHVLEHLAAPRAFLAELRRSLAGRPVPVYFEVPDMRFTLEDLGIWDLLYEHCGYFTGPSLARLFAVEGYRILQVQSAFAGQFLQLEAVPAGSAAPADLEALGLAELFEQLPDRVAAFEHSYRAKVGDWSRRVRDWQQRGCRLAIWGAGTKGAMFLNTVEGGCDIERAVDLSARKWGRFIPGTGQEVVPPEALRDCGVDVVLVMNAAYEDEIRADLAARGLAPELCCV